jgi:hypothetical protein
MTNRKILLLCMPQLLVASFATAPGFAADVNGVWATDASLCAKIFKKQGTSISFQDDSDIYGSGFIIETNRLQGKSARCTIKSRRNDGATIHMLASCATDIMLSNVQFSVTVVTDDTIKRVFPEMPDIEQNFHRCSL